MDEQAHTSRLHQLPQASHFWAQPAQEQDLREQRCEHTIERPVRRAGRANRMAIQAGARNDQPARQTRRAGNSGFRHPAQDAGSQSGRAALHRWSCAVSHRFRAGL